jgi:hypothetical protein
MANAFGAYDQVYYANEALAVLYNSLGFARRVFRRLDADANNIHQTIYFRRPMSFTATAMPGTTATETTTDTVTLTMNNWYGAGISLNDKELSYGKERIFAEHVAPLAHAVAYQIDATLQALYYKIPWYVVATNTLAVADIVDCRKTLLSAKVPVDNNLHLQLSPTLESEALRNSAFAQWAGSGTAGTDTQISGNLGTRYGFETYVTQTTPTHTCGVAADSAGTLSAEGTAGATSIAVAAVTAAGTFKAGDTLVIAGNTQRYAITANATADGGGAVTLSITPKLVQTYANGSVVTIALVSGEQSMAYHRDAFAVVMGALPAPTGIGANADIYTAMDQSSGLSLRVRRWYDPDNAAHKLYVDALWAVGVLNENMACRLVD